MAGITRDDLLARISVDSWNECVPAMANPLQGWVPFAPFLIVDSPFRSVMGVNLRGSFLTTRALARHVAARSKAGVSEGGDRAVVNVSSIVGKCGNVGQANCARNAPRTVPREQGTAPH